VNITNSVQCSEKKVMPLTRAMLDRVSLEEATLDRLQAEVRRYRLPVGRERSDLIDNVTYRANGSTGNDSGDS